VSDTFTWMGKRVRLIDLSSTLSNDTKAFEPNAHDITYVDHQQGMRLGAKIMNWDDDMTKRVFERGYVWSVEEVRLSTHSGTHVDAPYHYGPTMADGSPAATIDQVPLRWCFGHGVVLDMRHVDREAGITVPDVEAELERIGYALQPFDIVLVRTDTDKHFHEPRYDFRHPGLRREATQYLVEHGVRMIGIDAWGIDRAFDVLVKDVLAGKVEFWESHFFGLEQPYAQIEKLANLDQLPEPFGFTVMAFPYKIRGASAGWTRVVALVEVHD
jgi:kynurenine formamidase